MQPANRSDFFNFVGSDVDKNGNFDIKATVPGSYKLVAYDSTPETLGSQRIEVGPDGVSDATTPLLRPSDFAGCG